MVEGAVSQQLSVDPRMPNPKSQVDASATLGEVQGLLALPQSDQQTFLKFS